MTGAARAFFESVLLIEAVTAMAGVGLLVITAALRTGRAGKLPTAGTLAAVPGALDATDHRPERKTADKLRESRLWWRRLRGVRATVTSGAGPAPVFSLLHDVSAEVRAEAAAWMADHREPTSVTRLVQMLDRDVPLCRFAAQDALARLGGEAVDHLAAYLESDAARRPQAALAVATAVPAPRLLRPALDLSRHQDACVRSATCALLAAIGGDEAARTLTALLDDDAPAVRVQAARALGRLVHWPAAPSLARRLGDDDVDVRRAAALALRAQGAAGSLYLRRAIDGPDARAADMARHVHDSPGDLAGAGFP